MALILCIETATEVCSAAVSDNGMVLSLAENHEGNKHAKLLTTLINEALEEAGISLEQVDAIAVSKGPGSYTGLRVGVSTAKGLCYGLSKPLIAVNTLRSLTSHYIQNHVVRESLFVPMLDARRMEVYCTVFDASLKEVEPTQAHIVSEQSFQAELMAGQVVFFGNGAAKCKPVISSPNAVFVDEIHCSASGMAGIVQQKWEQQQFEDVAYFEPFYLKDFVGTTPRKQV